MALKRPMDAALPRSRYLKGTVLLALEPALDGVGGVETALHGHLADAGKVVEGRHVADGEDLGMPGQAEVGQHLDPAGAVRLGAGGLGQQAGER